MTRHFDYLHKDDEGDFFQKVAMDASGVRANQQPPTMTKTAAPAPATKVTSFEKVAARLDRDIEFLKTAGDCGISGGMQKRANAYIDVVMSNAELTAEQFVEVFDKVAAAAIEGDLAVAYDQLAQGLPEHEHHIVDDVLIKVGKEILELALMEKEAFLGALKGLRGARSVGSIGKELPQAAKAVSVAAPANIGAAAKVRAGLSGAKEVAKKPFQAAKKEWGRWKEIGVSENAARMAKARAERTAKIQGAPAKLEAALAKSREAEKMPGIAGTAAKGSSKSLEKQLNQANARATADAASGAKLPARRHVPESASPAAEAKSTSTKVDGERQQGAAKAQEAAKPPGEPPKSKTDSPSDGGGEGGGGGGGGRTPPPPGGADGKPPGFMDAWKKATNDGWKSLSPQERGALIRGGVTAALVARAVTGHGAVTGGEGLI